MCLLLISLTLTAGCKTNVQRQHSASQSVIFSGISFDRKGSQKGAKEVVNQKSWESKHLKRNIELSALKIL